MRDRAYLIAALSGTFAVLAALGAGAQVTPDPVLRPGAVPTDPALSPGQTRPAPVLSPVPSDSLAPLPPIFPSQN
jgi:hypothetical protein